MSKSKSVFSLAGILAILVFCENAPAEWRLYYSNKLKQELRKVGHPILDPNETFDTKPEAEAFMLRKWPSGFRNGEIYTAGFDTPKILNPASQPKESVVVPQDPEKQADFALSMLFPIPVAGGLFLGSSWYVKRMCGGFKDKSAVGSWSDYITETYPNGSQGASGGFYGRLGGLPGLLLYSTTWGVVYAGEGLFWGIEKLWQGIAWTGKKSYQAIHRPEGVKSSPALEQLMAISGLSLSDISVPEPSSPKIADKPECQKIKDNIVKLLQNLEFKIKQVEQGKLEAQVKKQQAHDMLDKSKEMRVSDKTEDQAKASALEKEAKALEELAKQQDEEATNSLRKYQAIECGLQSNYSQIQEKIQLLDKGSQNPL